MCLQWDSCRQIYVDRDAIASLYDQLFPKPVKVDQCTEVVHSGKHGLSKLNQLLIYMQEEGCLFVDFNKAASDVLLHQQRVVIIRTNNKFTAPQLMEPKDIAENNIGVESSSCGDILLLSFGFKHPSLPVVIL